MGCIQAQIKTGISLFAKLEFPRLWPYAVPEWQAGSLGWRSRMLVVA